MTIPLEQAQRIATILRESGRIQNLFAQSHAKYVLHEVNESADNFPPFDRQLEDKVTFTAYALLAAACSMLEQESIVEGIRELETAASLLQNAHGPFVVVSRESSFHTLVSAMAFYASGHYSRSFVAIRQIESVTEIAGMIAAFIRKDATSLVRRLYSVLLQSKLDFEDQSDLDEWVIATAIARSLAFVSEYVFMGNQDFLNEADRTLQEPILRRTDCNRRRSISAERPDRGISRGRKRILRQRHHERQVRQVR